MDNKCIYCGSRENITKEHVVPSSFFDYNNSHYSENLITVPACSNCNREHGEIDTYARFVLTSDIQADQNNISEKLRKKAVRSAIRNFNKSIIHQLQPVHLVDYHGDTYNSFLYGIDCKKMCKFFDKIIKGLFFHHKKIYLHGDYIIDHYRVEKTTLEVIQSSIPQLLMIKENKLGNVFSYKAGFTEDKGTAAIYYCFYGGYKILSMTYHQEGYDAFDQE